MLVSLPDGSVAPEATTCNTTSTTTSASTSPPPSAIRSPILRWFAWDHLKTGLMRTVSAACGHLAYEIDITLPNSAEKSAGLRKLLEAKDCFVRAAMGD